MPIYCKGYKCTANGDYVDGTYIQDTRKVQITLKALYKDALDTVIGDRYSQKGVDTAKLTNILSLPPYGRKAVISKFI